MIILKRNKNDKPPTCIPARIEGVDSHKFKGYYKSGFGTKWFLIVNTVFNPDEHSNSFSVYFVVWIPRFRNLEQIIRKRTK